MKKYLWMCSSLVAITAVSFAAGCQQNQADKDTIGAAPPPKAGAVAASPVANKPAPAGGGDRSSEKSGPKTDSAQ